MEQRRPLKNLGPDELAEWLRSAGHKSYRARQISEWLYRRWRLRFDDMHNLPQSLRRELSDRFLAFSLRCDEKVAAADDAEKFLFSLPDDEVIETVLIRTPTRDTVCVSTQAGCPVRCAFCASGRQGLARDLEAAEIVDQVIFACHELDRRVSNIVVMGMGEPLLNLDNVVRALDAVCDAERLGVGARRVTISTSGIVPGIRRLAGLGRQWNLALSLHAASEEGRRRLIPDGHRYPLADVLKACASYRAGTGRMITLEYLLLAGVNDAPDDMIDLAGIARDLRAKINLIPYNVTTTRYRAPSRASVARFLQGLRDAGARATVRWSRGADVQAACGQLRQRAADASGT